MDTKNARKQKRIDFEHFSFLVISALTLREDGAQPTSELSKLIQNNFTHHASL